ncbi:MAG: tyrosine-type recombinase/integrase [Thermaerobacter sp.]|nr:tyrosine-type recombinase/integrase [Thermaerobacter sp.]
MPASPSRAPSRQRSARRFSILRPEPRGGLRHAAAQALRLRISQATYATLIGLLAVTGMRAGEAIRLDRDDVAWEQGLLTVRSTKFGKSREVALHLTTIAA